MKGKKLLLFLVIACIFVVSSPSAQGEPSFRSIPDIPTVFKLLEKQNELDNQQVIFHGELIGQPIFDSKGVFVNVMDSEYNALGIYLDKTMLTKLSHYGRHGQKGDYIQVTGIFHKVCARHGGDTDLHANELKILKAGEAVPEARIPVSKIILCLVLLVVAFILFLFNEPLGVKT